VPPRCKLPAIENITSRIALEKGLSKIGLGSCYAESRLKVTSLPAVRLPPIYGAASDYFGSEELKN
jgi:hypothetical protein